MRLSRLARMMAVTAGAVAALALARPVHAQGTAVVRGTVTDSTSGQGLDRAQVTVVGTTISVATNATGEYVIANAPLGSLRLRVHRLGFSFSERQLTVAAGESAVVDFALTPIAAQLSEVVAVGYGTSSRENVSSSIASVTASEIANTPVAGVDAALQGKLAGVMVVQNAGNPGNGITIRVRGPASVNAGNQPLFVVDGVPVLQENYTQLGLGGQDITAITALNPDEIASIDVLKDAAAAGIYGSRGSNGVVIITTKRGQAGKPRISFNAYTGTQRVEKTLDLLNSEQYVEYFNESRINDGYSTVRFVPGVDDTASFDWQDAIFRGAPVSDLQLGVSGGSDRVQYYLSGSYFDQEGIVIGSAYDRASGRVNLDFNATDKLAFRTSVALTREENDRIEGDGSLDGVVTNAIGMQPMRPIRRTDGSFAGDDEGLRYSNPVALAELNSTTLETMRAIGNIQAAYHFTDRFSLTGRVGMDVLSLDETQWLSPTVDNTYASGVAGVGKSGHTSANKYVLESFASFDPLRDASNRLSLTGGASVEYNDSELNFIRGEGFTSGFRKYVRNAANVTSYDGSATEHNLVSYFARANYAFQDRYLLSASLRADGSSRFGEDNRYGVFPAASIGWIVTEEPFAAAMQEVADLKLRLSYGMTGNEGIGDFAALSLASGSPYSGTPGIAPSSLGNPELRWETTRELDAGVDLSMLDGRLGVIADYYVRRTSDLLVQRPVALTSGYSTIWGNVGSIENKGFDFSITSENLRAVDGPGLGWTTTLNMTFNRNRVTSLYDDQPIVTGINGRETSIVAVGEPLGSFFMYEFVGVDPATGDAIFRDVSGDGSITSADRTIVGNPHPDYFGGLSNDFTFRDFSLRTFLQFSAGNDVFNMMRLFADDGGCAFDNKFTDVLDRWQQPGDITDEPRASWDCVSGADLISSRYIEEGSYLRIGEVTLGYRLPSSLAASMGMQDARIYVSGRNLHTFTDYSGYNPDVNSAGSDTNVIMGTDYYAYPLARTFTIGISGGW